MFWSDNYISFAPIESKTQNLKFYSRDSGNGEPVIKIQGINLKEDSKIKAANSVSLLLYFILIT